jgi:hypothetical protein
MADTIQSLLAQLAKQSNSFAPPTMKSKPIKYKSSKYKKINLAPYNFSTKDFQSTASDSSTGAKILNALGTVLNDTIGQTSGIMTNSLYNAVKHAQNKNESTASKIMHLLPPMLLGETLAQGVKGGAKNQWKDWTDGKLSWGDIPSFGFLHGMKESQKTGEDIMKDEAGVSDRWTSVGGGLALDILLDPLTYLSGGASAAGKLSKVAELTKIKELSQGLGLSGKFKNANKFLDTARASMKAGMVSKYTDTTTGALKVSEQLIDKTVEKQMAKIADEIKTARNTTYNNHINDWGLAVPFTNKFGKIGTYGEKNLLHSSEATVDAPLVQNLIKDVAKNNPTHVTQLTNFAKARYGVDDLNQISKTQFDDLNEVLDKFRTTKIKGLPDSVGTTSKEADLTAHQAYDFNDALDMLNKKTRKTKVTEAPNILFHGTNKSASITKNGFQIGKHTEYGDNVFGNSGIYLGHSLKDAWYAGADARMPEYKKILGVHATPSNTLVLTSDKQLASLLKKHGLGEHDLDKLAEKMKGEGYDAIQVKAKTPDFDPAVDGTYENWIAKAEKNGDRNLIDKTGGNQVFVMDASKLKSLGGVKKGATDTEKVIEAFKAKHGLTDTTHIKDPLESIKTPTIKDPTKAIDKFKQTYKTEWEHFLHGNPEKIDPLKAKEFYKNLSEIVDSPYNKMGNFKTKFEHVLDKHNPFDSRTLKTGDKFVNSMGDHIADANSQRVGETARYTKGMDDIEKFIKKQNLSSAEKKTLMEHAIYILENHAPDKLGKDWLKSPPEAAVKLANKIRPVIDRLGSQESQAGVLDKLRKNYFPHVINKDEDTQKAIEEFNKRHPDLSSLNGKSSKSGFNKERKSFQTLAQRDNYIKKLEKAIQNETNPDTIESLQAQQERVAKMYDTDVVSALQRRIKEGVRAKAMKEMQGKLSKYGMMKTLPVGDKTHPEGLTHIDPKEAKKLGLGQGNHYIHPEVLKGMKRVDEIFTAEGMKKWQRHLTAFADAWRPLVTFYKLSHYRNNIIGNVINNLAAGVKASDYKVASKLILKYKTGKLTDAEMKLMESAFKHNVISGGFLYDGHQTFTHADPNMLEKLGKTLSQNKAIKGIRHHLGETPDDISRMANYINGINKFGSTEQAAKQVRTYLFNYNELTNADRGMRVIVPFWNWTKRNVPLQVKLLMENPKFAMNIERFKELFNDHEKGADWQKEGGVKVPDWLPIPEKAKNYYTTLPSPTNDLGQLLHPLELAGSMNPLPKSIIELMTNRKLFTGAPISYGSNSVQAKDLPAYAASNLGILGDLYKLLSGQRTPTESLINSGNPITRIAQGG